MEYSEEKDDIKEYPLPEYIYRNEEKNENINIIYEIYQYMDKQQDDPDINEVYKDLNNKELLTISDFVFIYSYIFINILFESIDTETVYERIKKFLSEKNIPTIKTLKGFQRKYEAWLKDYKKKQENELKKIKLSISSDEKKRKIDDDMNYFNKVQPYPYTEIKIEKIDTQYTPVWKDGTGEIGLLDGIEIFNKSVVSYRIPYIRYVDNDGNEYHKIYDDSNDPRKSHIEKMTFSSGVSHPNTIYITSWNGQEGSEPKHGSYEIFPYCMDKGKLQIRTITNVLSLAKMEDIVSKTFPNIDIGVGIEIKNSGEFTMTDFYFDSDSFYTYMLIEDRYNSYLNIDESENSRVEKRTINIHYKSHLKEKEIITCKIGNESISSDVSITLRETENGTKVSIIRAITMDILENFLYIFQRFITEYKNNGREYVLKYFKIYIPEMSIIEEKKEKKEEEKKEIQEKLPPASGKSKLGNLMRRAPELFTKISKNTPTLSRSICGCQARPIIIGEDEVEDWKNKKIFDSATGRMIEREVLKYPPASPENVQMKRWNFVCPGDELRYLVLKENRMLTDKDKEKDNWYPFIPCCGKTKTNLLTFEDYQNAKKKSQQIEKKSYNKMYRISTKKILTTGRQASLEPLLYNLLQEGVDGGKEDFVRYGVLESKSSLLHCVLTAFNDSDYLRLDENDREKNMGNFRDTISKLFLPIICKQELYDVDDEKIVSSFADTNIFLDPYLYYRAIEELYNINIFVFNIGGPIHLVKNIFEKEMDGVIMEIPRNKIAHYRTPRYDRKSMIVVKHIGEESRISDTPQIELIISNGKITSSSIERSSQGKVPVVEKFNRTFLFGEKMTRLMYKVLMKTYSYKTIELDKNIFNVRERPFARFNWHDIFSQHNIIGQRVDGYGKLSVIGISQKTKPELVITIVVPQDQPLNVPYLKELTSVPENRVIELFGEPSIKMKEGLWYPINDIKHAFFVSCEVKTSDITTMNVPSSIISSNVNIDIENVKKTRKYASVMSQIINWLWRLDKGKLKINEWWSEWVVQDGVEKTTIPYTNLLRRRFPFQKGNTDDGLKSVEGWWPTYFREKIYLYPSLSNKLKKLFIKRERDTDGLPLDDVSVKPPVYIEGLLENVEDFDSKKGSFVFLSNESMGKWITFKKEKSTVVNFFHTKINANRSITNEPYMYKDINTGKLYIIQNVKDGDFMRAVQISINWRREQINTGYLTEPSHIKYHYVLYGISVEGFLVPIHIDSQGDNFLQIMTYTPKNSKTPKYAAMLSIL